MAAVRRLPVGQRTTREYQLLRDSPLNAFSTLADLDDAATTLAALGYRVVRTGAGTVAGCLAELAAQVEEWPPGYVANLDGFHDGLRDLDRPATAFVLAGFDTVRLADPRRADALLDSLAGEAWWHAIEGRVLVTLVQSVALGERYGGFLPQPFRGWWGFE